YPSRFIVPKDSAITTVADLKGHTVGVPGKFGENWFALLVGLEQAGLTESDITIAEIGYTQQAALMTGKVDAVVGFANSDLVSFEAAGFAVNAIDPKLALVGACLATTTAYAQAHPEVVTAVVAGMRQGMTKTSTDEADTLSIAADYIPSFRGDALTSAQATLPATTALFASPTGVISPPFDPAQWTRMGEVMEKVDLIPSGVGVEAAYSNVYNA
ncbi:MAG: ABC transporter substrate-binding protein, partial [Propionibacteriaceae bacterium]|nr:ABC transporter substrate-binding protein [Propionibacteriaceae bacterium]